MKKTNSARIEGSHMGDVTYPFILKNNSALFSHVLPLVWSDMDRFDRCLLDGV